DVCSLCAIARQTTDLLRATESLNIFVENVVRVSLRVGRNFDFVRILRRSAVLHNQTRNDLGTQVATMARVARHRTDSSKVVLVDGAYHLDHAARGVLHCGVGPKPL